MMSYGCVGMRSDATEKGPDAAMFAGSRRSSGSLSQGVEERSRLVLRSRECYSFTGAISTNDLSTTHSAVEASHPKEVRCDPHQSTQCNPTPLAQLVTPTETKKPNSSNLADVVEAIALVPANRPRETFLHPPVFVIHPLAHTTLPSEHPDDVSVPVDPKTQMMPILLLIQTVA